MREFYLPNLNSRNIHLPPRTLIEIEIRGLSKINAQSIVTYKKTLKKGTFT